MDSGALPEGLVLTPDGDDEWVVMDSQDVIWVRFEPGGGDDPPRWWANIVTLTCNALGVERVVTHGVVTSFDKFIAAWLKRAEREWMEAHG